ncbi:hybrid sensor histidine kinase/response regulator [Pyruvatibacter sp.]|uniref:hybrid sensor histidine kinase/response regulator n=1 Tax=Pyruvatibacter sp. TaxID=1981328 RepID=UPI0032EDCD4D
MTQNVLEKSTAEASVGEAVEAIGVEQARLLYDRASGSALTVFCLALLYAVILTFFQPLVWTATWLAAASAMIGMTLLQPRVVAPGGITRANAETYLSVHTAVSGMTGLVWGLGAIALTDVSSQANVLTTTTMVISLTLGGIAPQAAFRKAYVALATTMLLPYAVWISFAASWPIALTGIGIVLVYAYFMSASLRVEIGTRDVISARQKQALAEKLREQRDAVQKVNEEKNRFLAATSHDLAQPLHAQGFYLAALRQKVSDPATIALLDKIETTSRSLGQLLDGLVEVTRLDAGAFVPDKRVVDLGFLAASVRDEFIGVASAKSVRLELQSVPTSAQTDPALFKRIIRNLVSNAIKFTPAGGVVTIEVGIKNDIAQILIRDTGIGIPAESLDDVFGEYVQLRNPERNREKGLGLGLSIVKRLATLLDVDLAITSQPACGTTVTLALAAASKSDDQSAPAPRAQNKSMFMTNQLRVLVIDDEESIQLAMAEVLTSWGCEVYSLGASDDPVAFLDRIDVTPDLLIIDYRLGDDQFGTGVIARLREELNKTIPALLMTGDTARVDLRDAQPATRVMLKPIRPEALQVALADMTRLEPEADSADEAN